MTRPTVPERFLQVAEARARFGASIDRLGAFLWRADPLADEAVESLASLPQRQALIERGLQEGVASIPEAPAAFRRFVEETQRVPFWVDWDILDRAGATFMRTGFFGGVVLGCKSLVSGYCSPGGNKPLVFTGQLREQASRRLNETSRYVVEVCRRGGLKPGAPGAVITLKVRLMHAQVRRMILRSGRWNENQWGTPANQHDMAGTLLLFSQVALEGLAQFGFQFTHTERDEIYQLWRYAGHLMGTEEELIPTCEREALRLSEMFRVTMAPPDEDSRALSAALMEAPLTRAKTPEEIARAKRVAAFSFGVSRALMGDELADQLGFPRDLWRFSVPALRAFLSRATKLGRAIPGLEDFATTRGQRYWEWVLQEGGDHKEFHLPQKLRAVPAAPAQ
jgi:hypothetical protein